MHRQLFRRRTVFYRLFPTMHEQLAEMAVIYALLREAADSWVIDDTTNYAGQCFAATNL